MMSLELPEWRAVAIGYAVGIAFMAWNGLDWWVPAVAIIATVITRCVWRS